MAPQRSLWLPRGYGGGGGGGDGAIPGPRTDFRDTAAYLPTLRTDANGQVQVSINLPHNLTTWRLTARAVTPDTQIAEAQQELLVTQDLLLQPLLPRLLTQGDTMELSAVANNRTDLPVTVNVAMMPENREIVALAADPTQSVTIPAGGQAVIGWPIVAAGPGTSRLEFSMTLADGTLVDALTLPLAVQRLAIHSVSSVAGTFENEVTNLIEVPHSDAASAYVEVTLNRNVGSSLIDGLEYLTGYPYGCVEQTMSRALPNAAVYRALTRLGSFPAGRFGELLPYVDASVQRLYGFQHYDGGWGWWYTDPSHDYQTAWVVYGLAITQQSGFYVDPDVLADGAGWLAENLANMDRRTRAFALYALALAETPDLDETRILAAEPERLDSFSVAALALSLHELDETNEAQPLIDFLLDKAASEDGQLYWRGDQSDGYYGRKTMASDVRNTALVLSAIAQIRPDEPAIHDVANWLMGKRRLHGWGTTNETSFTIVALTDYLVNTTNVSETTEVEVWWDSELIAATAIGPEDPVARIAIPADRLATGAHNIRLVQAGGGQIFYRVDTHVYAGEILAAPAGSVSVTRIYLDSTSQQAAAFTIGSLVRVEVEVNLPAAASYVLVEDTVPAGLEPINPNLVNSESAAQSQLGDEYDYLEIRDGRVSFFITDLHAGHHTFVYLARVVQAGEFMSMPAEAYAMYDESVWGRSEGVVLTVTGAVD